MTSDLSSEIQSLIEVYGPGRVANEVARLSTNISTDNICTILINEGLHSFPDHLFAGEIFVFYEGGLDFSSERHLELTLTARLQHLKKFLRARKWKRIYTVISGHAAVCMQVKLAVYRITHIETVDWAFDGAGNYLQIELPLRKILMER